MESRRTSPGTGPLLRIHPPSLLQSADMDPDAAYIEFTGIFLRGKDHKRFPFRVVFGSAGNGSGVVIPAGPRNNEGIASKQVRVGTPQNAASVTTALYEAEDAMQPPTP